MIVKTDSKTAKCFAARYGLRASHLKKSGIRHVQQADVSRRLNFTAPAGGHIIPYHDLDGVPTGFERVRFDPYVLPFNAGKVRRYSQAKDSGVHVYLSPLVDVPWREIEKEASIPLIITEGELKAACSSAHGLAAIGIGGVSMWSRKHNGEQLHRDIARFAKGRTISIAFDSDAATNPNVLCEENRLANALTDKGARVKVVRLG